MQTELNMQDNLIKNCYFTFNSPLIWKDPSGLKGEKERGDKIMSYESMSMEISNFCSEIYHGILGWFKKKPDTPLIPQPIDDDEGGGGSSGSSGGGASPSDAQNTIHNRNDELNFMNQNSVNPANNFGRNMRGGGGSGGTTSMVRDGSDFDDGSKFTGKIDANFGFISYNYLVGLANNLTLEKSFFEAATYGTIDAEAAAGSRVHHEPVGRRPAAESA